MTQSPAFTDFTTKNSFSDNERTWERYRDDIVVVTIWLIMLSYALASNILILIGIARNNSMRCSTSYWFITSLATCDIIMVVISLIHLLPATAFHTAFLDFHSVRNIIMIFFYDLFWYTAVLQLGLMACNRFVSIVYPMQYKWLFSPRKALFAILFGYALGFAVSLPTLFPCCHTLWNSDYYITVYDPMDTWYKYVDMGVNSLSLLIMIISYAVIIYKVRESSQAIAKHQLMVEENRLENTVDLNLRSNSFRSTRGQISKKELRLFIQFFVVSLVFLLTWTTWQWLPYISESKWAYFIMTSLFFINNSINPTVYLLFNTQLRHEIGRLLCNSSTKTVPPRHRRCLLTSNKLFKYTAKNQSTRISGSSNQHDGHCEASATQSGHNLLTIKTFDSINNADINKAPVNSAAALMTMTMANDVDTVDNNDVTNVTVASKKSHQQLLVENNIIIIGKNDTCDV
uniref:G_PROTEIN_RECEP_F1_2 domain-containing protein n=1 Tax=Onchocerca volvulus TaxID=6282 RepID=A0A8R1TU22_ONCVO